MRQLVFASIFVAGITRFVSLRVNRDCLPEAHIIVYNALRYFILFGDPEMDVQLEC